MPGSIQYNTSGLEDNCPDGFVLPDNPGDPDVEWISGTSCAVACADNITFNTEMFFTFIVVLSELLIIFLILTFISSSMLDKKRVNYMTVSSIGFSLFSTTVMCINTWEPLDKKFCRDNATGLTQDDGLSFCVFQAAVIPYCGLAMVICWGGQVLNIFCATILNIPNTLSTYKRWYILSMTLVPLIPVIHFASHGYLGYKKGYLFCFQPDSAPIDSDIWSIHLIFATVCIVSWILLFIVIHKGFSLYKSPALRSGKTKYTVMPSDPVVSDINGNGDEIKNSPNRSPGGVDCSGERGGSTSSSSADGGEGKSKELTAITSNIVSTGQYRSTIKPTPDSAIGMTDTESSNHGLLKNKTGKNISPASYCHSLTKWFKQWIYCTPSNFITSIENNRTMLHFNALWGSLVYAGVFLVCAYIRKGRAALLYPQT